MNIVFRRYKISINIGNYNYYRTTNTFRLPKVFIPHFLGYSISIITILLGFGGYRIFRNQKRGILNSIEALSINFSGGMDCTNEVLDENYDDKTNYVWTNLLRKTIEKINKDEVEIINEIQEEFEKTNSIKYSEENINFIIKNLGKIDIHRIRKEEIFDIFDAMQLYERHIQ